jgi:hypothetical protein
MDAWMDYARGDSARAGMGGVSLARLGFLSRRGMCFWRERIFKKMNGIGDDDERWRKRVVFD